MVKITQKQFRAWLKVRLDGLANRTQLTTAGVAGGRYQRSVDFILNQMQELLAEADGKADRIKKQ